MSASHEPESWVQRLALGHPGTAQEVILDELRTVILSGDAPPGTAIHVDDVAEQFVVSRIPVREALKTLIGEGLVEHQPRAGYLVGRLTTDELAELYLVRGVLEAAALTAAVAHAGADDDAAAGSAYDALGAAIAAADSRGHHRESRRFHLALTTPCGMHRLLRMFEWAWNLTEPVQPMSHVTSEMTRALHGDHRVMLDAFVARDPARLVATSARHYQRLQEVVAVLPRDVDPRT